MTTNDLAFPRTCDSGFDLDDDANPCFNSANLRPILSVFPPAGDDKTMPKELCKLQKSLLTKKIEQYMKLVDQPTHVCRKCGRVANDKRLLCKSVRLQ